MWKCKECGKEITGIGFITYETCGSLNKQGKIKKHELLDSVNDGTDIYCCNNCCNESGSLKAIADWVEEE